MIGRCLIGSDQSTLEVLRPCDNVGAGEMAGKTGGIIIGVGSFSQLFDEILDLLLGG